ncbi:glutamate racemase [Elusimicrobiota bacterium]
MSNNRPIGVFDSGMGGLTVLNSINRKMPNEDIIYYGDTAHLPYGNKSSESIIKYSLNISEFLKSKNIKMLVVACNTASVYALDTLKERLDIPVLGVVESGVNAALENSRKAIGIIGTYGTVKSMAYEMMIKEKDSSRDTYSRACPLFVPLIEEGWINNRITREVAEVYLGGLRGKIDSIILACTHYPLIKDVIAGVFDREIQVVDSAMEVAKSVGHILTDNALDNPDEKPGKLEYFVSDAPELFKENGSLFLGRQIDAVGFFGSE